MKDTSKAEWPEKMVGLRIRTNDLHDDLYEYRITGEYNHVASVYSKDKDDILEARCQQVRALPAMVALLKELKQLDDDDKLNIGSVKVNIGSILAQIGEGGG